MTSDLNMDGWKMNFLLGKPIFRGYVSFLEGRNRKQIMLIFSCGSLVRRESPLDMTSTRGKTRMLQGDIFCGSCVGWMVKQLTIFQQK